jgi:hypothetical protein
MVTTPQGVYVFSITETKSGLTQKYPQAILDMKYHFNDHLIKED